MTPLIEGDTPKVTAPYTTVTSSPSSSFAISNYVFVFTLKMMLGAHEGDTSGVTFVADNYLLLTAEYIYVIR